jgi:hypothetical protein
MFFCRFIELHNQKCNGFDEGIPLIDLNDHKKTFSKPKIVESNTSKYRKD